MCSSDAKRYCQMLIKENCTDIIKSIYEKSKSDNNSSLESLCKETLDVINKEIKNLFINFLNKFFLICLNIE